MCFSVSLVRKRWRIAHAKPTPATTGSSEMSFMAENRVRKTTVEMIMVKSGVDARTTWWNYSSAWLREPKGKTHWNGDKLEGYVADGDVDGVQHRERGEDQAFFGRQARWGLGISEDSNYQSLGSR